MGPGEEAKQKSTRVDRKEWLQFFPRVARSNHCAVEEGEGIFRSVGGGVLQHADIRWK